MTISRENFTNSVETLLDGAINSSVTTLDVVDSSSFPLTFFRIRIDDEIIFVTSVSGVTLTVIRGYEGTTAASHLDQAPVNHTFTVGSLMAARKRILGDLGMIDTNDSLSTDDDDFDDESFSGWTSVERSGWAATIIERNHKLSILIPGGTNNAQHYGYVKAKSGISGGDYVQGAFQLAGGGGNYPIPGIGFANGATYGAGNQITFNYSPQENRFFIRAVTNWDTQAGSEAGGPGMNASSFGWMHLRIVWTSSNNYTCYTSADAIQWAQVFSGSYGSVGTPTHAGIITTNWGSSGPWIHSYSYCRFSW